MEGAALVAAEVAAEVACPVACAVAAGVPAVVSGFWLKRASAISRAAVMPARSVPTSPCLLMTVSPSSLSRYHANALMSAREKEFRLAIGSD